MRRILVTGAGGQVGQEIQALQDRYPSWDWVFTDKEELDLSVPGHIRAFFQRQSFAYCIHCAAYTAVDRAESEPDLAARINAHAVRELAEACKDQGTFLIHISSDYVYDNSLNRPLKETDPTLPKGVYAKTKLEGDLAALEVHGPSTLILRASWIYSSFGHNFVKTMLRLAREREEIRVVCDQIGTPTYAADLAQTILGLIATGQAKAHPGVYNYAGEGVCSWYDFAQTVIGLANLPCRVVPIPSEAYPTPAPRPSYSVLDKIRFKTAFGSSLPYWKDSLKDCLKKMEIL
ncbi:MAG: dTDP-4-dehydrorhamnose reductase [Haliscomenobacter sp.]|nr:dTDP-4-dehydrorhamnose reductase [Haliscomenobacter sp.]